MKDVDQSGAAAWRAEADRLVELRDARDREARRNVVYLAKGPIVAAILVANLITALIAGGVYILSRL